MSTSTGAKRVCGWLLLSMVFLNVADTVLTAIVLDLGLAVEMNPVIDALMKFDMGLYYFVKFLFPTLALCWAWYRLSREKWNARIALPVLAAVTFAMTLIVGMLVAALVVPA